MLVYAGIDEAGYGPMLGPLCVAASVFVLPDARPDDGAPNLWRALNRAVCRRRTDRRRRIAVDDSKKLKQSPGGSSHPLRHLERGVLSFAAAFDGVDATAVRRDADLFERLGVTVPPHRWYGGEVDVPVGGTDAERRIASSRVRRAFADAGVAGGLVACEAIDVEAFNDGVARQGTKSSVNFGAVVRHVDRIWRRWPEDHPRVVIDRQGGRTHYREELQLVFPDARLQVLSETPRLSRYRLVRAGSPITLSFQPEAEAGHLPAALASMTAKYVRELLMLRLNQFFSGLLPELKPTAGYVQDARRYLADIEPVLERERLPRDRLIRCV
ncbi:MAG: hypothetical protein HKN62_15065 [Phycisphaerales bacterium]|nr:hypothetical protein [Phycisphaerales bacterium]